jgi:hypothetical protein
MMMFEILILRPLWQALRAVPLARDGEVPFIRWANYG